MLIPATFGDPGENLPAVPFSALPRLEIPSPRPSRCMNRSRELERQRIDRMSVEGRIRLALGLQERLALPTGAADGATLLRTRRAAAVVHEGPWRCLRFITRRPAGRDLAFLLRLPRDGLPTCLMLRPRHRDHRVSESPGREAGDDPDESPSLQRGLPLTSFQAGLPAGGGELLRSSPSASRMSGSSPRSR